MRGLSDLIQPLRTLVPDEILVVVGALLLIAAIPAWLRSVRFRQIKGCFRRAARATPGPTRHAHLERAFLIARGRPRLLADLTEHAWRSGFAKEARTAMTLLDQSGRLPVEAIRLHRLIDAEVAVPVDIEQATIRIERLMEAQLWQAARDTLAEAERRFPQAPEWPGLRQRLSQTASPSENL
jgi:hypothetical protein